MESNLEEIMYDLLGDMPNYLPASTAVREVTNYDILRELALIQYKMQGGDITTLSEDDITNLILDAGDKPNSKVVYLPKYANNP